MDSFACSALPWPLPVLTPTNKTWTDSSGIYEDQEETRYEEWDSDTADPRSVEASSSRQIAQTAGPRLLQLQRQNMPK